MKKKISLTLKVQRLKMLYLMKFQKFLVLKMKIEIHPQIYLIMNLPILKRNINNNKNKINKITTTNWKISKLEEIHSVNLLLENYCNNPKKKQKMILVKMIQTLIITINKIIIKINIKKDQKLKLMKMMILTNKIVWLIII